MLKKLLTTTAILAVLATVAYAGANPSPTSSVQAWLDQCNSSDSFAQNYCWTYTRAVADTAMAYASDRPFCVSKQLTDKELVVVARKFLKANPKMMEGSAAAFLANAFNASFGSECSKIPPWL